MNIIETKKLTKYYGKTKGIEKLDLTIKSGEAFGFIGPNGSGKSTTIRTLLNLIFPTSGEAHVMGLDVVNDSLEIRHQVGYLPGEPSFYDDMTCLQMLEYSTSFYDVNLKKKIKEYAKRLDLDLKKKGYELSLGNKKKLGIILAIIHDPKILILDEPTSGLDPLMQEEFFEILKEEKEKGKTIFFSSHVLSELKKICDRVGIIKDGKLIKVESIDDIAKNELNTITIFSKEYKKLKIPVKDMIIKNKTDNKISFLYKGDINNLIKIISEIKIDNLLIEEPSIEEIFMHYYK